MFLEVEACTICLYNLIFLFDSLVLIHLNQVYMVIDKQGKDLMDNHHTLPSLLHAINGLFSDLEISVAQMNVSIFKVFLQL